MGTIAPKGCRTFRKAPGHSVIVRKTLKEGGFNTDERTIMLANVIIYEKVILYDWKH